MAVTAVGDLGLAAGGALFTLSMGVMVWPILHRFMRAHRQRLHEMRVAAGESERK